MSARQKILSVLTDGESHTSAEIASVLRLSPGTVRRHVRALIRLGLDIQRISLREYRLCALFRPLDRGNILNHLSVQTPTVTMPLYLCEQVDSTNLYLLRKAERGQCLSGTICIAEVQRAGRGQRGRSWVATPYCNIMLSMAWWLDDEAASLAGLSLAAGVAVARGLVDYGITGVGLKWPNDILWRQRKLGGVLVDVHRRGSMEVLAIVGVGLNVFLAEQDGVRIGQGWTDLRRITGEPVDRDRLVALVIKRLYEMLETFQQTGFAHFRIDWEQLHVSQGQRVRVLSKQETVAGRALGVDDDGALRIMNDDCRTQVFRSGEISVRVE
jgi:BirA family biotin operon repressor/biotin-[acetyl-CoA-carboxylase] ligase